jgi:hypothetical protein
MKKLILTALVLIFSSTQFAHAKTGGVGNLRPTKGGVGNLKGKGGVGNVQEGKDGVGNPTDEDQIQTGKVPTSTFAEIDETTKSAQYLLDKAFTHKIIFLRTDVGEDAEVLKIIREMAMRHTKHIYVSDIQSAIQGLWVNKELKGACQGVFIEDADANVMKKEVGPVCMSYFLLKRFPKEVLEKEIFALLAHELAHMFGHDEREAKLVQDYFRKNYKMLTQRDSTIRNVVASSCSLTGHLDIIATSLVNQKMNTMQACSVLGFEVGTISLLSSQLGTNILEEQNDLVPGTYAAIAKLGLNISLALQPAWQDCSRGATLDPQNLSQKILAIKQSTQELCEALTSILPQETILPVLGQ